MLLFENGDISFIERQCLHTHCSTLQLVSISYLGNTAVINTIHATSAIGSCYIAGLELDHSKMADLWQL